MGSKLDALALVERVRKTRDAIVAEDDKGALVYWSVDLLDRIIALMERGAEMEGATEAWCLENGNVLTPITRGMRPTADHPLMRRVWIEAKP